MFRWFSSLSLGLKVLLVIAPIIALTIIGACLSGDSDPPSPYVRASATPSTPESYSTVSAEELREAEKRHQAAVDRGLASRLTPMPLAPTPSVGQTPEERRAQIEERNRREAEQSPLEYVPTATVSSRTTPSPQPTVVTTPVSTPVATPAPKPVEKCPTAAEQRYMNALADALDPMSSGMLEMGWLLGLAGEDPSLIYDSWWTQQIHLAISDVNVGAVQVFQLNAPSSLSEIHYNAVLSADEMSLAAQWLADFVNLTDFQALDMAVEAMLLGEGYANEMNRLLLSVCD